ncbi:MAG TPA: DUF2911 domain-containing protein [Candidatus Acidoferrales bacterium]|nr:DUF2911 domain-containing protein [Candidatus Acidoferrales bacterium]
MKLNRILTSTFLTAATAGFLIGQASPPKETSVDIGGKKITIKYSAPSMRGRQIFGAGGVVSKDPTYPVWRAGANSATALHTDANLTIGNLNVPAGDYTLFVALENPWKLIVSKETGEWGLSYHADKDLGRVPMTVSKPAAPIETYKMTLAATGGNKGKLTLEWENVVASVDFTVK